MPTPWALGRAMVPVGSVPMKLPSARQSFEPPNWMPSLARPPITLPAPATVPPTVLSGE